MAAQAGSLHKYFSNKASLVTALIDRARSDVTEAGIGKPPPAHLEDRVVRALLDDLTWRAGPDDPSPPRRCAMPP